MRGGKREWREREEYEIKRRQVGVGGYSNSNRLLFIITECRNIGI